MLSDNLKKLQDKQTKAGMGICGKCGSDNVDYGSMIPEGEGCYYEMECKDCGVYMHEWYRMEFDGVDVMCEDDFHATIEFLQEGDTILDERGEDD